MKNFAAGLPMLVSLLCPSGAQAASFDCTKARTPVEKSICADPALGRLDEAISQAYHTLLGRVEPPFQAKLQDAQKVWLKSRPRAESLQGTMRERFDDLRHALTTTNGVTLLRIDGKHLPPYVLTPLPGAAAYNREVDAIWNAARDDSDAAAGLRDCDNKLSNLNDEQADTPAMRKKIDDCDSLSATFRVYTVDFVSPDLLSVHEALSESTWREAHPANSDRHLNWWLSKPGKVEPNEIFASDAYRRVLRLAVRRYLTGLGGDAGSQSTAAAADAQRPQNWEISATSLKITGQGYDYGIGRGSVEITIPWRDFGQTVRPRFLELLRKPGQPAPLQNSKVTSPKSD